MEQKTRRAPGRPKASEEVVPKTPVMEKPKAAPKKKSSFKRMIPKDTARVYQMINGGGIVHMIQSRGVTVYDQELNQVREMRYCPNEPSIWVDEQSDNARKEAVIFRNGSLVVAKEKPNLMEYLDKHPSNKSNGGGVFKLVDNKKDAQESLEKEFAVSEAIVSVRDKSIEELLPVAIYFGMNINRPTSEIRFDLLQQAKKDPSKFMGAFNSPIVKTRATVQQAEAYQIVKLRTEGAYWFDSNKMIVANPAGHECADTLSRFLMTEKGATTLASLDERLEKLG